jgi:hypothetical protein
VGLKSLLDLNLAKLLELIEKKCNVRLPSTVIEVYLDRGHDLLFIRFREPEGVELGEPLQTKTPSTLFTDERSGEVTALEVIGVSDLLGELEELR